MKTVQNCTLLAKRCCFVCRVNVLSPCQCKLHVNKLICFQFCRLSSHCYLSFLSPQRGSSVGHSCVTNKLSDAFLGQLTMNLTR